MINKSILIILFSLFLTSCNNPLKSEPKFEFPEYVVSKERFLNTIKEADSVNVGIAYESEKTLILTSGVNKLVVKIYYDDKKNLDERFMKNQFEQVVQNAKREILNLKNYNVLEIALFKNNIEIERYEEVVKK